MHLVSLILFYDSLKNDFQVKEKCLDAKYRTTAFSDRPSVNDLDLELRSACPRIILQDIDSTSKVETTGWKRINTLAHYNVFFFVFNFH